MEIAVATVVVIVALSAALLLGWRQWKQWKWFKANELELSLQDQRYYRWSLGRRIAGCILLVVLAVMVYGIYAFDIASGLDQLRNQAQAGDHKLNDEQLAFVLNSWRYVIGLLLILMVLFILAGWDIYAIRRFGSRHRQRIRDDRRAMLARQLPILYAERRARQQGFSDDLPAL